MAAYFVLVAVLGLGLVVISASGKVRLDNDATIASQRLDKLENVVLRQGEQLLRQEQIITQFEAQQQQWRDEKKLLEAASHMYSQQYRELKDELDALKTLFMNDCRDSAGDKTKKMESILVHDEDRYVQYDSETETTNHVARADTEDDKTLSKIYDSVRSVSALDDRQALNIRADDTPPLEPVVTQLSQRVGQIGAEVEALKAERVQQVKAIQDAASSVYIRWGSSGCPHSAQLVYQGVVGGSGYTETGAAANFLCLSLNPVPGTPQPQAQLTDLYGAEYESYDTHMNMDAVCAVCRPQRPTVIMIPGTNQCPPGWTTEYSGYLMAGQKTHPAATEFICVDSQMESRLGGDANQNGKLLYFTEAACGSLPCHPYVSQAIVTCAVCSM